MSYPDIFDILYIHDYIIGKKYIYDEPIKITPEYNKIELTACINKLHACVENPKAQFGGKELYPTLIEKAGILFLTLAKNHAFENGNKRTAVFTLFLFMGINGCWLKFKHLELYNLAQELSSAATTDVGFDKEKQKVFRKINKGMIKFPDSVQRSVLPSLMRKMFSRLIDKNK